MSFTALPENLARVRDEIARAQTTHGIAGAVTIIGVTKGQPPAAVAEACRAGLADIGENRVQEAVEKQRLAGDVPVRWHLIGHLQTNKAKFVPGRFACVHSLDSAKVAGALAAAVRRAGDRAGAAGDRLRVLMQVNVAGEGQKSGCEPDDAEAVAHAVNQHEELELGGLMTMAPFTDDERTQRRVFRSLRELRERLESAGFLLPELSMGMSGDYRSAVAEGATMVRLGSVLFGERA